MPAAASRYTVLRHAPLMHYARYEAIRFDAAAMLSPPRRHEPYARHRRCRLRQPPFCVHADFHCSSPPEDVQHCCADAPHAFELPPRHAYVAAAMPAAIPRRATASDEWRYGVIDADAAIADMPPLRRFFIRRYQRCRAPLKRERRFAPRLFAPAANAVIAKARRCLHVGFHKILAMTTENARQRCASIQARERICILRICDMRSAKRM